MNPPFCLRTKIPLKFGGDIVITGEGFYLRCIQDNCKDFPCNSVLEDLKKKVR